jgi:hypothetical protein
MIPYVFHVALLITVCLLFYKALLQKETFYSLNRWVLLACMGLIFLLPLVKVPQQLALRTGIEPVAIVSTPIVKVQPIALPQQTAAVTPSKEIIAPPMQVVPTATPILPQLLKWVVYLYWFGVAAVGLNMLLQVIVLLRQAYKNPVIVDGEFRIIELDNDRAPCSFGNNIFINPAKYDWETYSQILLHEKVHIKQGHSLDLMLAELMLVFQWFNPFAWLYRKELENNLEFLTDNAVLSNAEVKREAYQMSLLKVSVPNFSLRVTTNYNQSLLKKRIVMMNAKRSNIHTTWKYFFLMPLMAFSVCALNQPIAQGQTVEPVANVNTNINMGDRDDHREGVWSATITGAKMKMEFRRSAGDASWMNGNDFLISEFSPLPKNNSGEFKLVRDAGTMVFTGKFDGNKGSGRYKFNTNPGFAEYLGQLGVHNIDKNDDVAFFLINLNKDYITMLQRNGYKNVPKGDLIAIRALGVDESYIKSMKQNGYSNITLQELVTGKALAIDGAYIASLKNTGIPKLSFDKLVTYKAQGIDASYISKFKSVRGTPPASKKKLPIVKNSDNKNNEDDEDDMVAYKSLGVDDTYVKSLNAVGFTNLSSGDLISMKALGITAAYIKGFKDSGYNVSEEEIKSSKAMGITVDYLNAFKNAGYKNINLEKASSLKALGVTAEYVKGFKTIGFNISLDDATTLKAMGITPEYITQMKEKGFKSDDVNKYITLKSTF